MWMLRGESHMSEVFSLDTSGKTVSDRIVDFMKRVWKD
jgi:hypothetical protein